MAAKTMIAARNFEDAGTGKSFTHGSPVDVDTATLANYAAAGLLIDPDDANGLLAEVAAGEAAVARAPARRRRR